MNNNIEDTAKNAGWIVLIHEDQQSSVLVSLDRERAELHSNLPFTAEEAIEEVQNALSVIDLQIESVSTARKEPSIFSATTEVWVVTVIEKEPEY